MGSKVKGTDIYVEVWTGAWTKVGGQKGGTISRGAGSIDITCKDDPDWEQYLVGRKNWAISFDAFLIESADDPGVLQLEAHWLAGTIGNYRITTPNHTFTGNAIIEGLDLSAPDGDASSISFTMKGHAALVKV